MKLLLLLEKKNETPPDDSLQFLFKYARELQVELHSAKEKEDDTLISRIEKDIHSVDQLIKRKKRRKGKSK